MKKLLKERSVLKDALKDLNKELRVLHLSKRSLERERNSASTQLDKVQAQELQLQNLITTTTKKEALLTEKIAETKDKITKLDQKIEKIRSLRDELDHV